MMSEKEKAFAVLQSAAQTCSSVLKALRDPNTAVNIPDSIANATLDARLKDFTSLLSLLHQDATKLAIALKSTSLTYSAAITPAKDIAMHADAFASCAYSVNEKEHGHTLACEVRWSAEEVLNALESLLGVYTADSHGQGDEVGSGAGEPYLVRTGVLHEAIDRARGISHTNREAVKKRWDSVLGGLNDCEKEVQEMIEDEEIGGADGIGDDHEGLVDLDEDDDWAGLGGTSPSTKGNISASKEELARLKIVHTLFKFTHALAKRVDLITLRSSSRMASLPPSTLDKLLLSADMLLKAADDLVHALYIPQDRDAVSNKSKDLVAHVNELRAEIYSVGLVTYKGDGQGKNDAITDLSQRSASLSLQCENTVVTKERKWFDTCFSQIAKSAAGLA